MTDSRTRVLVTGSAGALGRYLVLHLRHRRNFDVVEADRSNFGISDELQALISNVDIVVHLAGVNRAPDEVLRVANVDLANTLVAALESAGATPQLLYASTVHETNESVYGRSKREAGDILELWSKRSGADFTRMLLPHIYSEFVRPNYNSGIATFCHGIATGGHPEIIVDAEIHPLHASEVCDYVDRVIGGFTKKDSMSLGMPRRMSEILQTVTQMHELYLNELIVPDLREPRQLHLFNTYRTHLYPQAFPIRPVLHSDDRGNLFEAMRELNGGQSFISTTRPGVTRGNHFHFHKVERFCVLRGDARIEMRQMGTDKTITFNVSGDAPCYVDMPTLWTHNIANTGTKELLTLFWAHEIYDPEAADTYFEVV